MIEFRNVNKTYDTGTKAVKNANFVIENIEYTYYEKIIENRAYKRYWFEVKKNNNVVELSTREFELLRYLMDNAGIALSKEQIFTSVWGDSYGDIGAVAVNIKSLRDNADLLNAFFIDNEKQ